MGLLKSILRKSAKAGESGKNRIVLHLISNKAYQAELGKITKSISRKFDKIIYISLNKSAEKIVETLKARGIDTEKFVFVDAVNKKVSNSMSYHNFIFINSPRNFDKFSSKLGKIVDKENGGCLIFDSLSTMLIYQDDTKVIKFTHDLIAKLAINNSNGEFACLSEDVDSALVKDICMFVDEVTGLEQNKTLKLDKLNIRGAIAKFEKELSSIKQAFSSKYISEESYLKTKNRLENKLKSLKKRQMP
jgi:hypothetical protein